MDVIPVGDIVRYAGDSEQEPWKTRRESERLYLVIGHSWEHRGSGASVVYICRSLELDPFEEIVLDTQNIKHVRHATYEDVK